MNQASAIAFGNDATVVAGYAQTANERLGNIGFLIENTGDIDLYFQLRQYNGTTSPSGYANIGAAVTVKARGQQTVNYVLNNKQVGFFGSGIPANVTIGGQTRYVTSTTANVSAVIRNKGDLRGAQIDIVAQGRENWSWDDGFNVPTVKKKWGYVNPATGAIDPTQDPRQQ